MEKQQNPQQTPRAVNFVGEMVKTAAAQLCIPVEVMLAAGVVLFFPYDVWTILKLRGVIDIENRVIVEGGVVKIEPTENERVSIYIKGISHVFDR